MFQQELIEGVEFVHSSGRKTLTMDQSQAKNIQEIAANCIDLKATASYLCLPKSRVRELIDSRILVPIFAQKQGVTLPWSLDRNQLETLVFSGCNVVDLGKTVSLSVVLKSWRLKNGEFPALVVALLKGSLTPKIDETKSVPLGHINLGVGQLRKWLLVTRLENAKGISIDAAAKYMGLKQEVVYHLERKGLISSSNSDKLEKRLSLLDIVNFQRQYISLAALAKNSNCSPKKFLQQSSVEPVTGPDIDGGRQYFYLREHFDL
jgi:hypothetical protein